MRDVQRLFGGSQGRKRAWRCIGAYGEHSAICFELFGKAMRTMIRLGGELADVDTKLKAEDHRLAQSGAS